MYTAPAEMAVSAADRSRASALGAEGYVAKPFDIDSLLGVLHGLELVAS